MIKTKNQLLQNTSNPKAFFDILLSIGNDEYLQKILTLVKKEKELDLFLLANKALKNDYEVFKLQLVLDKLTFSSILNITTLLDLYKYLSSLHYEYITLSITQNIIEVSSSFSFKLYEKMIDEKEEFMISHISILFLSIYKNKDQYKELKKLFKNDNIYILQSAVELSCLINLSLNNAKEILVLFNDLKEKNSINLDKTILSSASKIKEKYEIFENILELYSTDKRVEIKYALSKILLLNKSKDITKPWFKMCLFSFGELNTYDKDILRNISFILNNIINETEDYKTLIEFFKKYLEESKKEILFS